MDKRIEAIERINKELHEGKRLSESNVNEFLFMARDYAIMYLAREVVSGNNPSKDRVMCFNKLQHACERWLESHGQDNRDKLKKGTYGSIFEDEHGTPVDSTFDNQDVN